MRYKTLDLIDLIEKNYSIEKIKETLNISNKELLYGLKLIRNKGVSLDKKIYLSEPNMLEVTPPFRNIPEGAFIHTAKNERNARFMVVSDLHVFSKDNSLEILDNLYNYCAKEGIHIILICGDLLNSIEREDFVSPEKQGEEFIKHYPFDKNITNISIMGNHEYLFFKNSGYDFNKLLNSERIDFKSIGYKSGYVYIKNDFINMHHAIDDCLTSQPDRFTYRLAFFGHSHVGKFNSSGAIRVPSLSYTKTQQNEGNFLFKPMGLDCNVSFKSDGTIGKVAIDQVLFENGAYILNENVLNLCFKPMPSMRLEYDESEIKKLVK